MKVMCASEFSEWVLHTGCREFIFDSDNSEERPHGFQVCTVFRSAAVSPATRRILFRNENGMMVFEHVKEVRMFDGTGIGTILEIVCETGRNQLHIWRFLAD